VQKLLFHRSHRQSFHSLLIVPVEQDSLIFIGCIDFALCDGEIDHPVIIDRVAEFDGAACAAKKR